MACSAADAALKRAINAEADRLLALKQQPVRLEDLRALAREEKAAAAAARFAKMENALRLESAAVNRTLHASQATRANARKLKTETQVRAQQALREIGDTDPKMAAKLAEDVQKLDVQYARVNAAGDALKAEKATADLAHYTPGRLDDFKAAEKTLAAEVDELVRRSDVLSYNLLVHERNVAMRLARVDQTNPGLMADFLAKDARMKAFAAGDTAKAFDAAVAESGAGLLSRAAPDEAAKLREAASKARGEAARKAQAEAARRVEDEASRLRRQQAVEEQKIAAAAREEDALISLAIRQQNFEDAVRAQKLADARLAREPVDARALNAMWGDSRLLLQKVGITGESTKLQAKAAAIALEAKIVKTSSPFATPDRMMQQELMRTIEALYKLYR
jgi:hypothetical protein